MRTRTMTRWVCGRCNDARLAPTRPRKDDIRRFCLKCSEHTGRLVARTAPTLEKRREERKLKLRGRRMTLEERAKEREEARSTIKTDAFTLNVRSEMEKMMKIDAFAALKGRVVTLHIRRCTRKPRRVGTAWFHRKHIQICDFPGITLHALREVLLHELAHVATPGDHHGIQWRTCFRLACEQYLGVRPKVERRFAGEVEGLLRERDAQVAASIYASQAIESINSLAVKYGATIVAE